jgi:hypothetical protein
MRVTSMDRKTSKQGRNGQRRWGTADDHHSSSGPELAFAASTLACVAAWSAIHHTFEPALVRPAITTLIFVLAAVIGVFAWQYRKADPNNVTYADVAGVLTLIGMCVASTIDPHDFVRTVFSEGATASMEPMTQRRER